MTKLKNLPVFKRLLKHRTETVRRCRKCSRKDEMITHQYDDNIGRYVQVVTPEVLRRILDEQGSDYSPPDHFGPEDEWDVRAEDEPAA